MDSFKGELVKRIDESAGISLLMFYFVNKASRNATIITIFLKHLNSLLLLDTDPMIIKKLHSYFG